MTVIKSAKTVEEALKAALAELGAGEDQVDYEVLEAPSKGFFGFLGHPAKVRVKLKEAPPPKNETAEPVVEVAAEPQETQVKNTPSAARAESLLKEIFSRMGLKVTMEKTETADTVTFGLAGDDDLGILIGKRGQTLDSLQYLANLAANSGVEEGRLRIRLEVGDYRARREETLRRLARSIAERVRRTRREVRLEPMNRHERKVIHTTLQGEYGVSTHSDGDEPYRCVVVTPKRRS